jgi:hypothetical protein
VRSHHRECGLPWRARYICRNSYDSSRTPFCTSRIRARYALNAAMALLQRFVLLLAASRTALAAFGVTTAGSAFRVDTGGGLVFDVNKSNGDITSLNYRGTQYQADKATHINSGLG